MSDSCPAYHIAFLKVCGGTDFVDADDFDLFAPFAEVLFQRTAGTHIKCSAFFQGAVLLQAPGNIKRAVGFFSAGKGTLIGGTGSAVAVFEFLLFQILSHVFANLQPTI